jgi:hypothetical protein
VRELGEIDMVSRVLATLDLVTRYEAQQAFPAVYLERHAVLSYGEQPPQRTHECGADRSVSGALRELLG